MKKITDEEYKNIIDNFNSGNVQIGVELSLARKSMNEAGNKTSIIWNSSFTIAMVISFFIRNI